MNVAMGVAAIALALLAWRASGQGGFVFVALGFLALLPAWSFRPVSPISPERLALAQRGRLCPRWARSLVGPGLFLIVVGLFQILVP
jgi:hypothetical protein